jgi:uncharacterized membrane protein
MSWTISSLKESAHMAFKANYWPCVGAALVSTVASGGCNFRVKLDKEDVATLTSNIDFSSPVVWAVIAAIVLGIVVFAALFRLLLLNPLAVGCNGFFVDNSQGQAEFSAIAAPFRTGWKRIVKTMFLRDLLLFIWILPSALLAAGSVLYTMKRVHDVLSGAHQELVFLEFLTPMMLVAALAAIPAFVKAYSYRLVPYLLAADPDASGNDAITLSRVMMNGHKFHAFLLDLSFLGWYILGIFTCGLLYIFFVFPYKASANAELYLALASPSSPESAPSPDPTLPPPLPDPFLP